MKRQMAFVILILILQIFTAGCAVECDSTKGEIKLGSFPSEKCEVTSTSTKKSSTFFNGVSVAGMTGNLAIDRNNSAYYPNRNGYVIQKIDQLGNQTVLAGSGAFAYTDGTGTGASFYAPQLVTIDRNDNLYVADGFKVRKVTPGGVVTTLAAMATGGTFKGIAADSQGNVFVVWDDSANNTQRIQKVSSLGVVTVFAGSISSGSANGTGTSASFNLPTSLVVDSFDNLYVADTGNYKIRKITPAGVVTTFAGSGLPGKVDADGTSASFYFYGSYSHMAIDLNNNIFVGDIQGIEEKDSKRMRKITSSGTVTTYCGTDYKTNSVGNCDSVGIISRFGVGVDSRGYIYFMDSSRIDRIDP